MLSVGQSGIQGRRDFLRVGGLGCLSLADMLAWKAKAVEAGLPVKDKSVVFLFMHCGPPQTETFDPKMDAPDGVRSALVRVEKID